MELNQAEGSHEYEGPLEDQVATLIFKEECLEQWLSGISICKDSIDNEVDSEMPDYSVEDREANHQ